MEENVCLIAEQGQLEEKLQLYEKYRKTERSKTNYIVTIEKTKQELVQLKQHQATFLDADQKKRVIKETKRRFGRQDCQRLEEVTALQSSDSEEARRV